MKTNRRGEYSSAEFMQFLAKEGIETERGLAHRPQANSVSERFFQTLLGRMQTQLIQSGLPTFLWGELAMYCSLQINCAPSKAIDSKIPILEYQSCMIGHVHPFNFNQLRPFGCLVFAHHQNHPTKLEPTLRRMIFAGLEHSARADRLWNKSSNRILVSGDITHCEDVFPGAVPPYVPTTSHSATSISVQFPNISDDICRPDYPTPSPPASLLDDPQVTGDLESANNICEDQPPPRGNDSAAISNAAPAPDFPRRPERSWQQTECLSLIATDVTSSDYDHPTYSQAMRGRNWLHGNLHAKKNLSPST